MMKKTILRRYGIDAKNITKIYRSAWIIDDAYVLKTGDNKSTFDKSIALSRLLCSQGLPAIEYMNTTDGEPYVLTDGSYWCLMKRIRGTVFDPFIGDPKHNGIVLGKAVAALHDALKNIEDEVDAYDADFYDEYKTWILPELEKGGVTFADGVLDYLQAFLTQEYPSLPRQLIHRDIHTSNLLFEDGVLTGYLDFDMGQKNARIFDVVYLACSQLVENYWDTARLAIWCEIFAGIVQGYNELLPLSEKELKAIPALFVFDEVLFTAFYAKTGQPETAKSCVDMTNWLYENREILLP